MAETRTEPLIQKLVDGLQEDMEEAVGHLERGLAVIDQLQEHTRGVNGLSAFLKAKSGELTKIISDARGESDAVAKKMLGKSRPEITERVNAEKAAEVAAARSGS